MRWIDHKRREKKKKIESKDERSIEKTNLYRQVGDSFISSVVPPFPAYLLNTSVTCTIYSVATVTILTSALVGAISV